MPLEIKCPSCSTRYRVGEDKAGKKLRCKRCQEVIPVPVGAPDDPFNVFDQPGDDDLFGASSQATAAGGDDETYDDPFGGFDMGAAFSSTPSMPSPAKSKPKKRKKGSPPKKKGGDNDAMFMALGIGALVVIGLAIGAFIFFAGRRDQGGGGGGGGIAEAGFGNAGGGEGTRVERGSLAAGDSLLEVGSGEFADTYTFDGEAGQRVSLALRSSQFDTYLILETPNGDMFENDDVGDIDLSALSLTLPSSGTYTVHVTSYEAGEIGDYELEIVQSAEIFGRIEQGSLASGDPTGNDGALQDQYTFTGSRGQRVRIMMVSDQIDPLVRLVTPNGSIVENDDAGSSTNSLLNSVLVADGEYTVQATSFDSSTTGDYTVVIDQTPPVDRLELGTLNPGDETLDSGEYADRHQFAGSRGQKVSITLNSVDFDPYIILIAPSEVQFDNDDFIIGLLDAELVLTLPETGQYQVLATTFEPGEQGNYALAIDFE